MDLEPVFGVFENIIVVVFKFFFLYKSIKIIFFLKKIIFDIAYQNDIKILKNY